MQTEELHLLKESVLHFQDHRLPDTPSREMQQRGKWEHNQLDMSICQKLRTTIAIKKYVLAFIELTSKDVHIHQITKKVPVLCTSITTSISFIVVTNNAHPQSITECLHEFHITSIIGSISMAENDNSTTSHTSVHFIPGVRDFIMKKTYRKLLIYCNIINCYSSRDFSLGCIHPILSDISILNGINFIYLSVYYGNGDSTADREGTKRDNQ